MGVRGRRKIFFIPPAHPLFLIRNRDRAPPTRDGRLVAALLLSPPARWWMALFGEENRARQCGATGFFSARQLRAAAFNRSRRGAANAGWTVSRRLLLSPPVDGGRFSAKRIGRANAGRRSFFRSPTEGCRFQSIEAGRRQRGVDGWSPPPFDPARRWRALFGEENRARQCGATEFFPPAN